MGRPMEEIESLKEGADTAVGAIYDAMTRLISEC